MDKTRYVFALIMVVSLPPGVSFWYVAHGYVTHWRRAGLWVTYTVLCVAMFLVMYGLYLARGFLLSVEFGWAPWLLVPVVVFYTPAIVLEIKCRKYLSLTMLVGVPELAADYGEQKLLQEGVYARIRHPRYLGITLGTVAFAFFTNYLAVYALIPLVWVGVYLITLLEERELVERFGDAYRDYQSRVPRLIPRLRG